MPEYKPDLLKAIAVIDRKQAGQFSSSQMRQPMVKASAGWVLPNRALPDTPDDGVHIYSRGGIAYWLGQDGTENSLVPVEVPVAAPVDIAANMTAGATAPSSYDQDYFTRLRDDVREVRAQLNALINSLRAAGLLDT